MSDEARAEAERRFPLWLPTGDYEVDREDYSELDAKWQNEDAERERAAFVAGVEWQAKRAADEIVALFPILGGVTDEVVEAGARGLTRHYFAEEGIYNPCEAKVTEHTVEPIRDIARAVLEAAFGKEQGDE